MMANVKLAQGQSAGNSPYSQNGIGDLTSEGFARNNQMGGTGVASSSGFFINNLNPATLSTLRYTNFDFGLAGTYTKQTSSQLSASTLGSNFSHLAMAFPISKKWGSSIGIKPYSSVQYEINGSGYVDGDTSRYIYNTYGKGNTGQFFFANGVNLGKGFSIGLNASYIFGSLNYSNRTRFSTEYSRSTVIERIVSYSQLNLKPGIFYRKEFNKVTYQTRGKVKFLKFDSLTNQTTSIVLDTTITKHHYTLGKPEGFIPSGVFFNAGITADYAIDINSRGIRTINTLNYQGQIVNTDTITPLYKLNSSLPLAYRIGFTLDKPYRWSVNADFSQRFWTQYQPNFSNTAGPSSQTNYLQNSMYAGIGGEIYSSAKFFGRNRHTILYRGGLYFEKTPYYVNQSSINDIGLSLGAAFQLPKIKNEGFNFPKFINLGIALGQRGTTSNNLIQERYIRFNISVSVNDKWFVRPKLD